MKTCGRRRTWQTVQMPSRAWATPTPLRRRDTSSNTASACGLRPRTTSARSAVIRSSDDFRPASSGDHLAAVGLDRFLFGREPGFGAFDERREVVGLDHQFENLVFERLDLALRKPDFLLDGVVFLIGLDGHGLLAELRETALVEGDVLLDRAAGVLVFGQPFLGDGHGLARGVEPRLERLLRVRARRRAVARRRERPRRASEAR